jgi:hypothetical protein
MDDRALHLRIRRLYAAIGAAQVTDMSHLPARVVSTPRVLGIIQDFSGGASSAELENIAISVILNVASLRDHLRRWASRTGRDKGKVEEAFEKSPALKIIQDLFDRDKHAGPRRDGGYSGRSPMLSNIGRVMRLQTQPRAGSRVTMVLGADGTPRIGGDGFAAAVLTGDVLDQEGERLGDLFDLELQAVEAWESLLAEYGVDLKALKGVELDSNASEPEAS